MKFVKHSLKAVEKELLKTQVEIQTETMKSIGREIHDNIGQKLTLSSLYLQQMSINHKLRPELSETIINVNEIISDSLSDLRYLSQSLTQDSVETNTIHELLKGECNRVNILEKYTVIFTSNLERKEYLYTIKSVLLRIAQEFIQNSIKHAQCKTITISLTEENNNLKLVLSDDGKGFDIKKTETTGIGLQNIRKRIKLVNGTFHFYSEPMKGTKFTIEIPV